MGLSPHEVVVGPPETHGAVLKFEFTWRAPNDELRGEAKVVSFIARFARQAADLGFDATQPEFGVVPEEEGVVVSAWPKSSGTNAREIPISSSEACVYW